MRRVTTLFGATATLASCLSQSDQYVKTPPVLSRKPHPAGGANSARLILSQRCGVVYCQLPA